MQSDSRTCPVCQAPHPTDFFSLRAPGNAGRLWATRDAALAAAVGDIDLCLCNNCGFIFNRSYDESLLSYEAGYDVSLAHSPLFRDFMNQTTLRLLDRYDLRDKTVVEIGCGQGDFLRQFCRTGSNRGFGFDPTLPGQVEADLGPGHITLVPGTFGEDQAGVQPDLVCALGVLDCIPRPVEFLAAIRGALGDRAPVHYVEVFNAGRALAEESGWSVHYESCNYWTLPSLTAAFSHAGYRVLDSGTCYGNGEYLYIEAVPGHAEDKLTATEDTRLHQLADNHARITDHWRHRLETAHATGKRVALWGTGGKGTTFLCQFPAELIDCVVDINPNRQGTFTPVTGHRIDAPDVLKSLEPDLIIVTNALYETEIRAQVSALGLSCEVTTLQEIST